MISNHELALGFQVPNLIAAASHLRFLVNSGGSPTLDLDIQFFIFIFQLIEDEFYKWDREVNSIFIKIINLIKNYLRYLYISIIILYLLLSNIKKIVIIFIIYILILCDLYVFKLYRIVLRNLKVKLIFYQIKICIII